MKVLLLSAAVLLSLAGCPSVTYGSCAEAAAASAAPLREGDPGYSRELDRDGDGTACEST